MSFTKQIQLLFMVALTFCNSPKDTNLNNKTGPAGTVTDIDGNVYQTVKIGTQIWTVENLRTTKYNDGTPITLDTARATWKNATTEKFCYYLNTENADSIMKWGALYNWFVVSPTNPKKIAPKGWHIPSNAEWSILQNYLIANGYNWDGTKTGNKIAKSFATKTDWDTSIVAGTVGFDLALNNDAEFSALPGGYRRGNGARFFHQNLRGYWWTATENNVSLAYYCYLLSSSGRLGRASNEKSSGYSVRLLKD